MAKHSHILQLIRELYPNGAPMCKLEDACSNIYAGGTPLTSHPEYYDGDIPWLRSGEIDFNIITSTERNITQLGLEKSSARIVPAKSVLMAMTGATVAKVAITEIELTANQSVCALVPSSKLNYRYLYYYLSLQYDALRTTAQGALTSFNLGIIKNIRIPLPSLQIQEEIVRILDAIVNLSQNIEHEIEERRKQFVIARETLLNNNSPLKSFGELGEFKRGNGLQKTDFSDYGIGCIHYGQIYTKFGTYANKTLAYVPKELANKLVKAHHGDLVIACTGETVEDLCKSVAWMGKEDIVIGGHSAVYRHEQDPLYISYFFQTHLFAKQKAKYTIGAKVYDIKTEDIAKIQIPLPSLKEQQAIAAKLDTIEAFIANLNEERTLRQQQYEYYRAKLISLLK